MSKRLNQNLTSQYLAAAQRMKAKGSRERIVAYVESYDDVFFWRGVLGAFENERRYFEVKLPSHDTLGRGKKVALMNVLKGGFGQNLIACVDADYDYLMQGSTDMSRVILQNEYVFHTYAYAIESYQCYAPALHEVCVMATLNDRAVFDFETFLTLYSQTVYPLFVWSVWCYRKGRYARFTMADFCLAADPGQVNLFHPEEALARVRHKVNKKMNFLQQTFPEAKGQYVPLKEELARLGVTPETCYMYMRGHDLSDYVVSPLLTAVCDRLRREREREIRNLAVHKLQMQNELAGYQHSSQGPLEMLRKHTAYRSAPPYKKIEADVAAFLSKWDRGVLPGYEEQKSRMSASLRRDRQKEK